MHGNVPVCQFLAQLRVTVFVHLLYFPNLALADFWLTGLADVPVRPTTGDNVYCDRFFIEVYPARFHVCGKEKNI